VMSSTSSSTSPTRSSTREFASPSRPPWTKSEPRSAIVARASCRPPGRDDELYSPRQSSLVTNG
jgi:hypothetical protein